MQTELTIRAWKDRKFRATVKQELPANPAGTLELTEDQVDTLATSGDGVTTKYGYYTWIYACCLTVDNPDCY